MLPDDSEKESRGNKAKERERGREGEVDERGAGKTGVPDKQKNNRCLESLVVLGPGVTA